jgi:hypothetical protein
MLSLKNEVFRTHSRHLVCSRAGTSSVNERVELLERVARHVDYEQICWAFYFASGSLAINNVNTGRVERLSLENASLRIPRSSLRC